MKTSVAVLRCPSYDPEVLDRAVAQAALLADMPDVRGKTVLLKPNILSAAAPEKAISTRGEVLAAFARLLKSKGAARIIAGESPAFQSSVSAARKSGIEAACAAEGVEWVDFAESSEYESPAGKRVKRFTFASALKEADLLISLPKLKTHRLMRYTGAIKNLFGLVPGLGKSAFHMRFPNPADFGSMLVDIALVAKPAFTLMDAVISMEGDGPANGTGVETGLILASRDPLALDWIAASLIGYDPLEIPYLVDAASRGVWVTGRDDIEVRGLSMDEAKIENFEILPMRTDGKFFTDSLPAPVRHVVRNLAVARPFFDPDACISCGACVKICPPKALALAVVTAAGVPAAGAPRVLVDYEKCIRCYCCHEVCPEHAISLHKRPF